MPGEANRHWLDRTCAIHPASTGSALAAVRGGSGRARWLHEWRGCVVVRTHPEVSLGVCRATASVSESNAASEASVDEQHKEEGHGAAHQVGHSAASVHHRSTGAGHDLCHEAPTLPASFPVDRLSWGVRDLRLCGPVRGFIHSKSRTSHRRKRIEVETELDLDRLRSQEAEP